MQAGQMAKIKLQLAGPVSVTGPQRQNLTPPSMKSRGILAILGTSHQFRASRTKLQDKLWSGREPEQGAASLRQALTEIRRSLGDYRDALLSGSGWAALDANLTQVELRPDPRIANPDLVEFAEDLDVKDPEFEEWIREQRQFFTAKWQEEASLPAPTVASNRLVIQIEATQAAHRDSAAMADMIMRDGAERAAAFIPAKVFTDPVAINDHPQALRLSCRAISTKKMASLQFSVLRNATGQQVWTRSITGSFDELIQQFGAVSGALTLAILHAGWDGSTDEKASPLVSLRDVFSFSEERLNRAEAMLAADDDPNEQAIRLALRAYIRNTMLLERFAADPEDLLLEATEFATRAMELDPQNAVALSVGAMIAARNRNVDLALDLAIQAEHADADNPLARYSLSTALSEAREDERAFQEAIKARAGPMTALSPATWLMRCAVTAVRAGRLDEALRFSKMAHGHSPDYRPPLRFMAALEFKRGNETEAARALNMLHAIEPDFSLDLMASDSYPVATLRSRGLLAITKSGLF